MAVGRGRVYYGWYVVAMAALAMVGTLPGRTQGLGLITEPLLGDQLTMVKRCLENYKKLRA